jgi:hypothetical protein
MTQFSREFLLSKFGPGVNQMAYKESVSKAEYQAARRAAHDEGILPVQPRDVLRRQRAAWDTPRPFTPEEHAARLKWPVERIDAFMGVNHALGDQTTDAMKLTPEELYELRLSMWSHGKRAQKPVKPEAPKPVNNDDPVICISDEQAAKHSLPKGTLIKRSDLEQLEGGVDADVFAERMRAKYGGDEVVGAS